MIGDTAAQVWMGAVVPLVVAAACLLAGTARRSRAGQNAHARPRDSWRLPLALGAPVALAFFMLYGWPREQWQHLALVPVAGIAIGIVAALTRPSLARGAILHLVLALLVTAAIWPVVARERWMVRLIPAAGTLILAAALVPLATRRPGLFVPVGLLAASATVTAMVLLSGFMKLSVPSAALAFALLALVIAGVWRPALVTRSGPGIAVVAPILVTAPLVAWLYMTGDAIPAWSFLLAAGAPLALLVSEFPGLRRRSAWMVAPIAWLAVAAMCVAAILGAVRGATSDQAHDPYADVYQQMMGK